MEIADPCASPKNSSKATARITAIITAVIVAVSGSLIAAPSASAARADLVWCIERIYREVVDIKGDGDITVVNGTISKITAAVAIPGGRQSRQTMLAFEVGNNTFYTTSLVTANAGTPPHSMSK